MKTLLPQVLLFLRNWIPTLYTRSYELHVVLYYIGVIIENAFTVDWKVRVMMFNDDGQ